MLCPWLRALKPGSGTGGRNHGNLTRLWGKRNHPGKAFGGRGEAALTCSEHMEFIPGICSEFICIWPAMGLMFWTLVFPPAMETVMLMLLYIPCCAGAGCVCPVWLNTLGGRGGKKG